MLNKHTHCRCQRRLAYMLLAFALLLIAVSSCGGGRTITSQGTPRPFIANDAITQAMALQPPAGVNPAVFNKLRDELVRQLTLRAEGKLALAAPEGAGGQVTDLAYDAGTSTLTWSYANAGDYNIDGSVGVSDITPIAAHFGASTTDGIGDDALEAWIDGSGNHVVDISDITPLAMGFGSQVNLYAILSGDALDGLAQVSIMSFDGRNDSTVPPTFSYIDTGLPASGAYCEVQPQDASGDPGIESLPVNIATGGTVISSGTIGPEGGVLSGSAVEVDFAAGTFAADTPLTLETGPDGRYEDQASGGFYITGIPDTFSEPITVRLKMTEPPGPDGIPLLALEEGEVLLYGTQAVPGRDACYFQGTVDNGWFITSIPPTGYDLVTSSLRSTSAETDKRVYVTIVNRRHYLNSTGGHFLVYFPAGDEVLASTVADALDEAYTQIETDLGMSWARRTTWPLEVTIRIMGADSFDGEMLTSRFWGVNGATITINSTNMASDDIAKATTGHELMHVAQYCYDKRNRVASSWSGGGWIWMDDATATWFEKRMVTAASYIPSTTMTNVAFLMDALATDTNEHGYGASMFMTYMAGKEGDTFIGDVSKLKWDSYQPIDAIKHLTSSTIDVDWKLFCESFMRLAVYGAGSYPTPGEINSLQQESFMFDEDVSTWTHNFTWSDAPDLSARIYRLQFKPYASPVDPGAQWQDYDDLAITFYGNNPAEAPVDAAYIICSYANSTWNFIAASSEHEYTVNDLKAVADANGAVYIMVVNESATAPYLGTRAEPIHLDIERKEDFLTRVQKCNELRFEISCDVHLLSPTNEWDYNSYDENHWFKTIQWTGASFTSDLEIYLEGTATDNWQVSGTVDPVARTVSLTYNHHRDNSLFGTSTDTMFAYTDVPLSTNWADDNLAYAMIYGPTCASMVTGFSSYYDDPLAEPPYWQNLISLSFPNLDNSDYIAVEFTKNAS